MVSVHSVVGAHVTDGAHEMHITVRHRQAITLVELLVVLAILAGMIALLMPAVQNARESARSSVCLNNLRQIGVAARSHAELTNQFPKPGEEWTVTILEWIEERPLQEALRAGRLNVATGNRPRILQCPSQPDPAVNETGVLATHYMLEAGRRKGGLMRFNSVRDRNANFEDEQLEPWFIGPLRRPERQGHGPHNGQFNKI